MKLKEILYVNFNDFNNSEVKEATTILIKLILRGKSSLISKYQGALIDSYKFLSEAEYLAKDYESCLKYINQLQLSDAYKNEAIGTVNHATVRKFQCEIYLDIYEDKHDKIKLHKQHLLEFGNANKSKFEKNIKDDYDKILDLANSFLNNSVKTIVNFKLPYKIEIPENQEIVYEVNHIRFSLKFKTINNEGQVPFESNRAVLELDKDKYGVCSCSDLILVFNRFFDATRCMDDLLKLCSEAFNYFLDYYKSTTEYYWIDNLNLKQIQASNVRVISEKYDDIISIPLYYPHNIKLSQAPSYISQKKFDELQYQIIKGQELPLWKMLYLDSKNHIFIEKYKESVISINSAFENYLNIVSRDMLRSQMTEKEIEDYLQGNVSYSTYFLNDFISEEAFNKAVEQGTICSQVPSTFQIIKKCYDLDTNRISVSRSKINKLINNIRKNRNDIIHGNLVQLKNLELDAKNLFVHLKNLLIYFNR